MHDFRVRPIPTHVADHVRLRATSPQYGHPAHREVATGTGPCRVCLAPFAVGIDDRVLFTYNPFEQEGALPLPGPVFIHASGCTPHSGEGFPAQLRPIPLVIDAHGTTAEWRSRRMSQPNDEEETIAACFADPAVRFLHLRHSEAGCFIARVDRGAFTLSETPHP